MPANTSFGLAAAELISGNADLSLCGFVVPLEEQRSICSKSTFGLWNAGIYQTGAGASTAGEQ